MKKALYSLAIIGSTLALGACSSISPFGAQPPEEYDYVLSCKLKQDDPQKCEAQVRALCPTPAKTITKKSRVVDPVDNAVVYVYQTSCQ